MPRAEDIAWKLVIRRGKKWCCPYCKNEYSGSVARVKGHFLKHPKEGIASCTKVPEHIRTLMELLHNQVHKKEDLAWKFVDRLEDNKWRCHYCSREFFGDLAGVKGHLLKVPIRGISICTEMPDHVTTLMRLLLDEVAEEESGEVAEEESGEAHGQSSMEQKSAKVAEEESGEANHQFSTKPESHDKLPPVVPLSLESWKLAAPFVPNCTSDRQGERQFHQSLIMPSSVQNSHATVHTSVSQQPSCHWQTGSDTTAIHPQHHLVPLPGEESLDDQDISWQSHSGINYFLEKVDNQKEMPPVKDKAWKFVIRLEGEKWCCPYCKTEYSGTVTRVKSHFLKHPTKGISPCKKVPEHISKLMDWLNNQVRNKDDIAWKFVNRLEDNKWRCHYCSEEFFGGDLAGVKGHLLGVPNGGFSTCTEVPDHIRTLMWSLLDEVAEEESRESNSQYLAEPRSRDMPTQLLPLLSPECPRYMRPLLPTPRGVTQMANFTQQGVIGLDSDQQSQAERQVQHSHGNSNCSQDCNQHSQLQTQVDIDASSASQHTIDPHVIEATIVDLQVPQAATNTTGPSSSSEDMNRGSAIMDVRSIYANNEEIRNLKRKVEELDDREAVIKEQMEIESAASSVRKKPRILVARWLKETVRARNKFQIIGQAHVETLPPKERVESLMRNVEELIGRALPQTLLIEERDAKGVKFCEQKLTGEAIQRKIELIWHRLKKNHACKLGIYGMGGVGKTTIMMHIHNRLLKDAAFDGVVFITVSQDFSIYKLQSGIWKALNFGVMEDEHEKKRAVMLSEQLGRKKNCVLILDDVWERLDLEEVGIPVKADGLKLVLTSRSFHVCCQMQCQEKIKIKPLSQREAESLFLEELECEVPFNLEFRALMKSIVKECAGLPIGIIMMARSMRGVTDVFEWRDSLVKLKESSMGQTDMEKVLMKLKLSYDRLGDPDVQQCLLSCALYPEDEFIEKFELVEFFIDQGLIGGLKSRKEQYDRGLTILKKLGNACLLEDWVSKVKMHNMIRDMALHIMGVTSIVKARKSLRRIPPEENWTDALEKVSLMWNHFREFPRGVSPNCPKLSTLLLNGCLSRNVAIPDSFFKKLLGLKVLNLSGNDMTELPNSISHLINLRALLLRKCRKLHHIPYLGKLTSLRKLDASGCVSLETPKGLKKLVNLRYLDLSETRIVLKGSLEHLLYLQYLRFESEIRVEDVDHFNDCVRVIKRSDNPLFYKLTVGPRLSEYSEDSEDEDSEDSEDEDSEDSEDEDEEDEEDEEYLEFKVEVSDDARFGNLNREVHIGDWDRAIVSVGGECTSKFILIPRDVQTMTMRNCGSMRNFSGMGLLENLERLYIFRCENLGVLCGGQDEEVYEICDSSAPTPTRTPLHFPNLTHLIIRYCPRLKYLFGHGFNSNLPHLREIHISDCKKMVGITAAVTPPPHPLPAFPSLERTYISGCDKMERAVEPEWMPHFPNLQAEMSTTEVLFCL